MAIRADLVGGSGAFGPVPLFTRIDVGDLPLRVCQPWVSHSREAGAGGPRGIPTVVYRFSAALVVAPLIRDTGTAIGLNVSSKSALAAGLVMGIMIIPFVSSLADDVINAVPQSLRDGSYGIGG